VWHRAPRHASPPTASNRTANGYGRELWSASATGHASGLGAAQVRGPARHARGRGGAEVYIAPWDCWGYVRGVVLSRESTR